MTSKSQNLAIVKKVTRGYRRTKSGGGEKKGKRSEKNLTGKQLEAIALLGTIPPEYKGIDDACKILGVGRTILWEWRKKNEKFKAALAKRLHDNFEGAGGIVRSAMLRRIVASKGGESLFKLFFQVGEGWVEKKELDLGDKPLPIIDVGRGKLKKK